MADIEHRAEKAWQEFSDSIDAQEGVAEERDCFLAGYMAGVAQTQRDYAAYDNRD